MNWIDCLGMRLLLGIFQSLYVQGRIVNFTRHFRNKFSFLQEECKQKLRMKAAFSME